MIDPTNMHTCLYAEARKREWKQSIWLAEQRGRMKMLIDYCFQEIAEEKKDYWKGRIFAAFNHRFSTGDQFDWLEMIADFSDAQMLGQYSGKKMQRYLLTVREEARKYTKMKN